MVAWSRRTILIAMAGAVLAIGCRDALGLQGLRFEERPAPETIPVVLPRGTGGGIAVTPVASAALEFPQTIELGLTLFGSSSTRAGALFVGLAPDSPRIVEFLDASGVLEARPRELPRVATHLLHFDTTTGTQLAAYAAADGLLWMFQEEDELRTVAGSPGWTTLTLGAPEPSLQLLAYDSHTGLFRVGAADFEATPESPTLGVLPTGFDVVSLAGASTALLFSSTTRNWEIWRLAEGAERVAGGSFQGTHLFAVDAPAGTRILGYDATTGEVARYAIEPGDVSTLRKEASSTWPAHLDSFAPHAASGTVFVYNSTTGIVDRRSLDPLEDSPVIIK